MRRLDSLTPAWPLLAAVLAVSVLATPRQAAAVPVTRNVELDHTLFGNLDQDDVPVCKDPQGASLSCGPVAAVNSFVWLQNRYPKVYGNTLLSAAGADLDGDGATDRYDDMIQTAIDLAAPAFMNCAVCNGGTEIADFIAGKQKWIESKLAGKTAYAHESIFDPAPAKKLPSWQFLYDALQDEADVELLFGFYELNPNNTVTRLSGHIVTVTGFHWTDADMDGIVDAGEGGGPGIDFIDPATGLEIFTDIFQTDLNGVIAAGYLVGGQTDLTYIDAVVSERPTAAAIPAPAPFGLLLASLTALAGLRRRAAA